mgnify:FL=1
MHIPAWLSEHSIYAPRRNQLLLAVNEAFTNVLKHSRATRCRVAIVCSATALEIIVSDDGAGFDLSAMESDSTAAAGNGLRNMQKRLTDIGGSCRIRSKSGEGTTIQFILPFEPSHE